MYPFSRGLFDRSTHSLGCGGRPQVTALEERNLDLDRKTKERYTAAALQAHRSGAVAATAAAASRSRGASSQAQQRHSGAGLTVEVATLLFPGDAALVAAVAAAARLQAAATTGVPPPAWRGLLENNRFLRRALMRAADAATATAGGSAEGGARSSISDRSSSDRSSSERARRVLLGSSSSVSGFKSQARPKDGVKFEEKAQVRV